MRNKLFYWCPLVMATLLSTQVSAFNLLNVFTRDKKEESTCDVITDSRKKAQCRYDHQASVKTTPIEEEHIREHQQSRDQMHRRHNGMLEREQAKINQANYEQKRIDEAQRIYNEQLREKLEEERLLADKEAQEFQKIRNEYNNNTIIKTFFLNDIENLPDQERLYYLDIPFIAATATVNREGKVISPIKEFTSSNAMCQKLGYKGVHPQTTVFLTKGFTPEWLLEKHNDDHNIATVGTYIEGNVFKVENRKFLRKGEAEKNTIYYFFARITCWKAKESGKPSPYTQNVYEMQNAEIKWDRNHRYLNRIIRYKSGDDARQQQQTTYSKYQ